MSDRYQDGCSQAVMPKILYTIQTITVKWLITRRKQLTAVHFQNNVRPA
jgi:hypothetical protein